MIQDKVIRQIEQDELKYAKKILIYRYQRLNWKICNLDLPNNKEAS